MPALASWYSSHCAIVKCGDQTKIFFTPSELNARHDTNATANNLGGDSSSMIKGETKLL